MTVLVCLPVGGQQSTSKTRGSKRNGAKRATRRRENPGGNAGGGSGAAESTPQKPSILGLPVLVLNRLYAPVCVTTARRAVSMLYGGAANALGENGELYEFDAWRGLPVRVEDDGLAMVSGSLRIPRVLHLSRYDRNPRVALRLTRRNLLLRDDYQCQYCAARPGLRELNVDHVLPRSRGGGDTWENLVISCRRCNLLKGQRTPEEASMTLSRTPRKPSWSTTAHILLCARAPYAEWEPFLQAG